MRIVEFHSHLNGYEWLKVHHPRVWGDIKRIVRSIDSEKYKTKVSKEKSMKGRLCYSPVELNARFCDGFHDAGWKESRTSYWVTDDYDLIKKTLQMEPARQKIEIESAGKHPIFSYNQTDFVKDRVAVEVQLGKYSFIAYDLFVKHLAFYVGDQIDLGIEILAMKSMQAQMSSGPGYYEGALYDLARQGRGVPAVPLILIGIAP
jgi:hypothetical protein